MIEENNTYKLILKKGLLRYKFKNSKGCSPGFVESEGKKGVVFGFRTKANMTQARGFVIASEEAVYDNKDKLSHWTPNVFNYGGYIDEKRSHVVGFTEKNLQQINTFVLDIDCLKTEVSSDDILIAGIEIGVSPTMILETPNGYQAYFVLRKPSFISKANDFKSLRTNKAIDRSLKYAFSKHIKGVDFGCNPFGIFRFPNDQNIVYYVPEEEHDFKTLMYWSMKVNDDYKQEKNLLKQANFKKETFKQTKTAWFNALMNTAHIKGGKGLLGRNSAMFTASLACYSSDMDKDDCIDLLDEFNTFLEYPLSTKEVKKVVRSAYSGRYHGASAQYIQLLKEQWGLDSNGSKGSNKPTWYKFAKQRKDRERSHYKEWRADLVDLIHSKTNKNKPFIQITRVELIKALGIPESSLKDLMRELKEDSFFLIETKAGRGGYTRLATRRSVAITVLEGKKLEYTDYLKTLKKRVAFPELEKAIRQLETIKKGKNKAHIKLDLITINTS